ncbi:hypothetical protein [Pedobacter sp. JY14-1]|uniref:hypothetical protein n=1 Tax=Pedobacter sp. JY14-1 TaxID=3034151 RepID=UPI0023E0FFC8|nr:hypothetical protein [Pedobacter sp. JY14-1]
METIDIWSDVTRFQKSFIFRWGLLISLIILAVFFCIAATIRVPVYTSFPVQLSERQQKLGLVSNAQGKIKMYVSDGSKCKKGDKLAYIANVTSLTEVIYLQQAIDTLKRINLFEKSYPLRSVESGDITLQTSYNNLKNQIVELESLHLLRESIQSEKDFISQKITLLNEMNSINDSESKIKKRIFDIKAEESRVSASLYNRKIISRQEIRSSEESELIAESQLINSENSKTSNKIQVLELKSRILEREQDLKLRLIDLSKAINSAIYTLQGNLNEWQNKYLIVAPSQGEVYFSDRILEDDFIKEGQLLFYFKTDSQKNPVYAGKKYIATGLLNKNEFHKIQPGDIGRIELTGTRVDEDGYIVGRIERFYGATSDPNGKIVISLTNDLKTSTHKQVRFVSGIDGLAYFKAKNETLLKRIFNKYIRVLQSI